MSSTCTVLYSCLWPVWLYHIFPHYFINGTIFGKAWLNIKCMFWFYLWLLSKTCPIPRRIQWVLPDFNESWGFYTDFLKMFNYRISWKSVQWEPSCSMQMAGQTWWSYELLFAISRMCLKIINMWHMLEVRYHSNLPPGICQALVNSVKGQQGSWVMVFKWLGGSGHGLNEVLFWHSQEGLRKTTKLQLY
jgi:hypothetical protein